MSKKINGDFYNAGALAIFAALHGRTPEEEAQSMMDQLEEEANESEEYEKDTQESL